MTWKLFFANAITYISTNSKNKLVLKQISHLLEKADLIRNFSEDKEKLDTIEITSKQ